MSVYRFITRDNFSAKARDIQVPRNTVNWVMPPPSRQSGGHINIFRFILGLEARGFDCRVVVCNDGMLNPKKVDTQQLKSNIDDWFGSFKGSVYALEDMPPAMITMATGWQTAYSVKQFKSTVHKGYFVQDFEPSFYPSGAEQSFSENTYKFGFMGFTAGGWLADKLKAEYGMKTFPLSFSYDKKLYKPIEMNDASIEHLLCYVRPETIRRGWDAVNLALEMLHEQRPDLRFILVGGYVDTTTLRYPAFNPGSVRVEELANLYSQCRAALILSCTNLSLLPLEVMACGVPVVTNRGKNVEWLLDSDTVKMADMDPIMLKNAVLEILDLDQQDYRRVVSRGLAFAKGTSWGRQIDKLSSILKKISEPVESAAA